MSKPPIIDQNSRSGLAGIGPIPAKAPVASFNLAGIENLIETKGFSAIHIRHAYIPNRATESGPIMPSTQVSSQRGHMYYKPRPILVIPYSISLQEKLSVQGIFDIGSVILNISGQYQDESEGTDRIVQVSPSDLIVMNEPNVTVPTRQVFEYNPTGNQKLNYRIKGVDVLFDDKNQYIEDRDFVIVDGMISWCKNGLRPDFINSQGSVLSIVYYITPIFLVSNLPHSLRIIPSNDVGHGTLPRAAVYAPQLLVCKPSQDMQEIGMSLFDIPNLPGYPASSNLTGGST